MPRPAGCPAAPARCSAWPAGSSPAGSIAARPAPSGGSDSGPAPPGSSDEDGQAGAAGKDLAAIRPVGVPDRGAWVATHGESTLVDRRVVALAEQRPVLAAGRPAEHPVDHVVDVAPRGRCHAS